MSRSLFIRPRAQRDIDDQAAYFDAENPEVADSFLFERLQELPHMGSLWPSDNPALEGICKWPLREFSVSIFYRPSPTSIEIVRVFHQSRDIPTLLEES